MGRRARELVESGGIDVEWLINELNKAYADEWIAFFYYKLLSKLLKGIETVTLVNELNKIAMRRFKHQEKILQRVLQLKGEPVMRIEDLPKLANCPYVTIPDDTSDPKAVIRAALEAERCSINVYSKILDNVVSAGRDPITLQLLRELLKDELEHEEVLERLLAEK
ncbi:MAG TPA: bacterioferritin [Thermofilum sp.]|nr:MAG: bacterioferritin [Thermoprotei archaeon]HDI31836.1 bacterioferritin [Thermofilum sp.]